jgi:hypothetical protein
MSSARYMTGSGAADNLFSNSQGMGLMDLDRAISTFEYYDQFEGRTFTSSGDSFSFTYMILDSTQDVRITLAWTDAPGCKTAVFLLLLLLPFLQKERVHTYKPLLLFSKQLLEMRTTTILI